ncbi:MAG TPA: penicillin acylase family protein [Vicinamibacterales bacterium]|nr:penicillin acylase family protein [Vicinamibacterales bacterium]
MPSLEPNARGRSQCAAAVAIAALLTLCHAACGRAEAPGPPPTAPPLSGSLDVYGLSAPVRVIRDRAGIPHIYAQNRDDLFFAQGFVQAQDRLFQMDLWRRSVQGRLAEVLGPNFAERDAMTRRIQARVAPASEWPLYGPDAAAIAGAFVRGINTYLANVRGRLPEPFVLAGWTPELWAADDLLNRTDAFAASSDALEEVLRARLVDLLGASRAAAIVPGGALGSLSSGLDASAINAVVADAIRSVGAPPFFLALARQVPDRGSVRSQADVPLDARVLDAPSRRYLVHLNAPGWNVIGATSPWLPGVEAGHNSGVAWTFEPIHADTQDVYVERLNPANDHEVEENDRWVPTTMVSDTLRLRRRADPFSFDREFTRHGVVLAVDRVRHLAFVVRWSGIEPGASTNLAGLSLDRAASSAEIRAAIEGWRMPPRRVAYDDVAGDRGTQIAGVVPVRRGWSGALPVPGWGGAYEWTGFERPARAPADSPIVRLTHAPSERVEMLLRELRRGEQDPRVLIVNAIADSTQPDRASSIPVLFTHVLSVTPAARHRFDVGPLTPVPGRTPPFTIAFDTADWDRSTVMNAPGQSEHPDSAHYADLARLWSTGESILLPFTDRAVEANAESTLILQPPQYGRR